MAEESKDFSEEFKELHENSSFGNDDIHTEIDYTEDEDIRALKQSSHKKKKKKKSKKEKKDKLHMIMMDMEDDELDNSLYKEDIDDDTDFLISKKKRKGKADLFDIKQAKKQKKKNIEARFAPQITALRKILKDTDATAGDIRGILDKVLQSKSRYTGKSLTDLLMALNSANSNRASVVRDISNIQKTIIDLKLKQDKANPKKEDKDIDEEEYGINLFRKLLSGNTNRKEMLDNARDYYNQQPTYDDGYDDPNYEEEDPNDAINARLNNEDDGRRTKNGTAYIKYENMQPKDVVIYEPDGNWYMDAVDKDGNTMPNDYPRLSEMDVGKIRFDMDSGTAMDSYGRRYDVIQR